MQRSNGEVVFSASDLVKFVGCKHATHLDLLNLETPLPKAADTDEMLLVQGKGFEHEERYVERLREEYGEVVDLKCEGISDEVAAHRTEAALRRGAPVVFQGTFKFGNWVGHADFLVRVETPSALGAFSYEVVDTKLARSAKAKFLIQLCMYTEMVSSMQQQVSRHMHVVLGDGRKQSFIAADYLRYYRQVKTRFMDWVAAPRTDSHGERSERCPMCQWRDYCSSTWEAEDHLNRVAGIAKTQVAKLKRCEVPTMAALAATTLERVPGIQPETLARLRQQARLQVASTSSGEPVLELLPAVAGKGFSRLPAPADGDLFFDMEGNPLEEGGLEYLFGLYFIADGEGVFKPFWAHTREEERHAFEGFIDFVAAHLREHPGAHIYHYASYETTALKRLMCLHGTREAAVDDLLRARKFVDLYAVVREAVRVGEPSYSIKFIERFYRAARTGDVKTAGASIVFYEKWKATGDAALLQAIEDYNRDDVVSTYQLRQWLESLRPQGIAPAAAAVDHPATAKEKSPAAAAAEEALEVYRNALLNDCPVDRLAWAPEHRLRELLLHLLHFHRRAEKPVWWALFARQEASEEELLEDAEVIACLKQAAEPEQSGDGWNCTYSYPEQEFKLKSGDNCCIVQTLEEATDVVIDEENRLVRFHVESKSAPPVSGWSLGSGLPVPTGSIQKAFCRFVDAYLKGSAQFQAGLDYLRRSPPRVSGNADTEPLLRAGEGLVEGTSRVVSSLENSYVFVQGPPGAGKTFTGSRVILQLLKAGKKVAVASNSHKAINNLLHAVEAAASEVGFTFRGAKKSSGPESMVNGEFIADMTSTPEVVKRVSEFQLVAGTAWLFSAAKLGQPFDYLFVDEAGQVSLANLLAMSTCAKNLVLLGDQMQLGQPIQGVHPGESGLSSLEYLLQGEATIAPELGVFLKDTWRMHPRVCRFISDAVYDGRLEPRPENARQRLALATGAHHDLRPTGVRFIPVEHDSCTQRCVAEADAIQELVTSLLRQSFVDKAGATHQMGLQNILVVAPYNQQVNWLKRVLPEGARVGTVDKFQGQEAEVVLVSMTTSSGEYLPRNLEFLYSKNRLNVAISRARCLALVLASPKLLDVDCSTPEQMALVNTLCWVRDYSSELEEQEMQ